MVLTRLFSFRKIRKSAGSPDYVMLVSLIFILVFGFLMLSSASADLSKTQTGDTYFFLKNQLLKGFLIGSIAFLILYFIDLRHLNKLSLVLLILSIVLLILIFTPFGEAKKGAARWLDFKLFSLQPAEIIKFTFIIFIASWLSGKKGAKRRESLSQGLIPFLLISGAVSILIFLQPATSIVAVILFSAFIVYFLAGAKKSFIFWILLAAAGVFGFLIAFYPYRLARVSSYVDYIVKGEITDAKGSQYQLNQALLTLGSGGLFGVGYGNSLNKKTYLPEPIGDSIFSVIAEEFGFIGGTVLLLLFFIFILRGFLIAMKMEDLFSKLVMAGFCSIIGIQVFIHIGANSGIAPMTGMPLPFVSYGSSAMIVFLSMAGVMLNISKKAR